MNTKARFVLIISLALLAGAGMVVISQAAPWAAPLAPGGAPTVVAYQGQVTLDGSPYEGKGYFKFAVVNAGGAESYWSNDGSSSEGGEPETSISLDVTKGLFNVLLGDTSLENMEEELVSDVFEDTECYLRVWFSDNGEIFELLSPDRRVAAVPYALQAHEALQAANADTLDGEHAYAFADATHNHVPGDVTPQGAGSGLDADTVDGLHAGQLGADYQNVVIVAKSGGDYTSVQAAIDSITDAAADNPYLVWVAPGVYVEQVMMKPYVHLQGAGQDVTVISSTASSSAWPPDQATLVLASDTSLRDLAVGNSGAGDNNVALMATAAMTRTLSADVTARAQGNGTKNYAIFMTGNGTGVTLRQVTALAESGSTDNYGLLNEEGAAVVLRGGSFTGSGGDNAWGIYNVGSNTTLEAEGVAALGEEGGYSYGLYNYEGAFAILRGGLFTGRGGVNVYGIRNQGHFSLTTLEAGSVTALSEDGVNLNFGLDNYDNAFARLSGGSFTGRGGAITHGIRNDATLEAESVSALGENGTNNNYGLFNNDGTARLSGGSFAGLGENGSYGNYGLLNADGTARLNGGSFAGSGGANAGGISTHGSDAKLEAESVTALGEDGSDENYGLGNFLGTTILSGGSFSGSGGDNVYGIRNDGVDSDGFATLEADSVAVLGESGSNNNYGLYNTYGIATLRSGSFIGSGGTDAYGIHNFGFDAWLEAENVNALGGLGSDENYGLNNDNGVLVRLLGGSFIGYMGADTYGIRNYNESHSYVIVVEGVTALGEGGSSTNYGLYNDDGDMMLHGGSFTGRAGTDTYGIYNISSGAKLEAERTTARGEGGSNGNYGLYNHSGTAKADSSQFFGNPYCALYQVSGTVRLGVSQLDGEATRIDGSLRCFQVYDHTYTTYTCP